MPAVAPLSKVLVSGINGYLATWVVRTFLEKGYSVRGTARMLLTVISGCKADIAVHPF